MAKSIEQSSQSIDEVRDWQAELPFLVWHDGVPLSIELAFGQKGYAVDPAAELPADIEGQVVDGGLPFDAIAVADYSKATNACCRSAGVALLLEEISRANKTVESRFVKAVAQHPSPKKSNFTSAQPVAASDRDVAALRPANPLAGDNDQRAAVADDEPLADGYPSPQNYARDKWIYENIDKNSCEELSVKLKEQGRRDRWAIISSRNGMKDAARRYADFHKKPSKGFPDNRKSSNS